MGNKVISEMRHEVIENTIKLELMLDNIIEIDLGFEPNCQEIEDKSGDQDFIIENEKYIQRFREFFLGRQSLEKKFNVLKDIINEDSKKSVQTDIWKKAKRLREIRNIFAHTLAPKYPDKPKTIAMVSSDLDSVINNIEKWEKLYSEHTQLFKEIYDIISNLFYIKLDLKGLVKNK